MTCRSTRRRRPFFGRLFQRDEFPHYSDSTIVVGSGPHQTDSRRRNRSTGRRNRSTANELSPAERLGRGAYEPPRPRTLVPTNEAVSTSQHPVGLIMLILAGAFLVGMMTGSIIFTGQQPVQTASTDGRTALAFLLNGIRSEPR
jgi:hypothetical protein